MNFKEYWNSQDLDKYRTTEDYCAATWDACKKEVLKVIKANTGYGDPLNDENAKHLMKQIEKL